MNRRLRRESGRDEKEDSCFRREGRGRERAKRVGWGGVGGAGEKAQRTERCCKGGQEEKKKARNKPSLLGLAVRVRVAFVVNNTTTTTNNTNNSREQNKQHNGEQRCADDDNNHRAPDAAKVARLCADARGGVRDV